jgi:hypothetical protein
MRLQLYLKTPTPWKIVYIDHFLSMETVSISFIDIVVIGQTSIDPTPPSFYSIFLDLISYSDRMIQFKKKS